MRLMANNRDSMSDVKRILTEREGPTAKGNTCYAQIAALRLNSKSW